MAYHLLKLSHFDDSTSIQHGIVLTPFPVGMERTLRLLQSIAQILSSYTLPFNLLIYTLTLAAEKPPSPDTTHVVLLALRQQFGLIRRFFRLFRFLESFNAAHKLCSNASSSVSSSSGEKAATPGTGIQTEEWLDIFGRTFNGMYLLLEASTTIDALQIDGLAVWAPETSRSLAIEAQRFWLFALICGVFAGSLRVVKVLAYTPVPVTGDVFSRGSDAGPGFGGEGDKGEEKEKDGGGNEKWDLQQEQARLRALASDRKKARSMWRRDVQAKIRGLARGVLANALDVALPGSAVGWLDLEPGTVGVAMFATSILTGLDVWERCGREVGQGL